MKNAGLLKGTGGKVLFVPHGTYIVSANGEHAMCNTKRRSPVLHFCQLIEGTNKWDIRTAARPTAFLCVRMIIGECISSVQMDVSSYLRARGRGAMHGTNRDTSVEHVRTPSWRVPLAACHAWCLLHLAAQLARLCFARYMQIDLQWIGSRT